MSHTVTVLLLLILFVACKSNSNGKPLSKITRQNLIQQKIHELMDIAREELKRATPLFTHLRKSVDSYAHAHYNVLTVGSFENGVQLPQVLQNGTYIIEIDLMFLSDSEGLQIPVTENNKGLNGVSIPNPTVTVIPVSREEEHESAIFVWLNITRPLYIPREIHRVAKMFMEYESTLSRGGYKGEAIHGKPSCPNPGYSIFYTKMYSCPATNTNKVPTKRDTESVLGHYYHRALNSLSHLSPDEVDTTEGYFRQLFSLLINSLRYFPDTASSNSFFRRLASLLSSSVQNRIAMTHLDEHYRQIMSYLLSASVQYFRGDTSLYGSHRQLLTRLIDSVLYLHSSMPIEKTFGTILGLLIDLSNEDSVTRRNPQNTHQNENKRESKDQSESFFLRNKYMRDNIPHSMFATSASNTVMEESELDLWLHEKRSFRTFRTDEYSWINKKSEIGKMYIYRCLIDKEFAIKLPWPEVALEWSNRNRKWPASSVIKEIVQHGCHVVPEPRQDESDRNWKYSFVQAEQRLMKLLTEQQKLIFLIFKQIKKKYLSTVSVLGGGILVPSGLTSFHLNTIMLWVSEQRPPEDWESNLVGSIESLLAELLTTLKAETLQHYFVPEVNIFKGIGELWERKDLVVFMKESLKPVIRRETFITLTEKVEDILNFPELYFTPELMTAVNEEHIRSLKQRLVADPIFVEMEDFKYLFDTENKT